jgi:D-lactate dehydrogenase (cytochrome)
MTYVLDPTNEKEVEAAHRLDDRMVRRALSMGGTCTGEHGIGLGKIRYLDLEHGLATDVMRGIKHALDPDNRMNPGKMVEPRSLF